MDTIDQVAQLRKTLGKRKKAELVEAMVELAENDRSVLRELQMRFGDNQGNIMQIIEVQFPARRYHATPWDAHVNEGRVEWPPCPWRILRALLAVGYSKLGWHDEPTATANSLIEKLAGVNPQYVLPTSTRAHTRHYMPYTEGKNEKKTKVFDTFVKLASADAKMLIRYDLDLDQEEQNLLENLVEGLAYLGRAESWVEANLLSNDSPDTDSDLEWIAVADSGSANRMRLLVPLTVDSFLEWRDAEVETAAATAESKAKEVALSKAKNCRPPNARRRESMQNRPIPPI